MAKSEFTTYTYEVSTCSRTGQWVLDTIFSVKWRAIEHAESLVNQNKFSAVRVTSESSDPSGRTNVIFEQKTGVQAKNELSISRVDEAPPCSDILDYYQFPARKTVGRLLRHFLNTRSISALELLFDYGNLLSIERHDTLLMRATQRITTLQTQGKPDLDSAEINNSHHDAFDLVIRKAKILDMDRRHYQLLKDKGVKALLDDLEDKKHSTDPQIALYHTLSVVLNDAADYNKKLFAILELRKQDAPDSFHQVLDEVIAELMDNSEVIASILKIKPEVGLICEFLIKLCMGEAEVDKKSDPCIEILNEAMLEDSLPITKELLMDKVRGQLRNISPLMKSSGEENRECFVRIVRSLKERTGFVGGPDMSAAITLRAKITLKSGPDDLDMAESIESILGLVPDPAIRLGYLLDLSQSDLKKKYGKNLNAALVRANKKVQSISSLIPDLTKPSDSFCVLSGIMFRLNNGNFEPELKSSLEKKVIEYLKMLENSIESGEPIIDEKQPVLEDPKPAKDKKPSAKNEQANKLTKNITVKAGDVIFKEGDKADSAYIVKKGSVEISKTKNGSKVTLITLGTNQIFGELALLEDKPRSATAIAVSNCLLTRVTKKALDSQMEGLNGFVKYWLMHLSDRVLDLSERIEK
ncbi:cyclic nucleotide-binding domain-containing protein [Terasakiella sp. A23]|uniref:cyclic nucleotide-binding domain-containing protein n=1 Tax=Terasakiella sp. FCG-A23 TaxID=3080561 RepID=UPI002952D1FC|nr:cyclic nucleotide-binding domain-containing protein [Terasakiella sp. A23]MDV7338044.1 cyclic nucleotide-binding domain-containing protein [Terasakiella sp. A23]